MSIWTLRYHYYCLFAFEHMRTMLDFIFVEGRRVCYKFRSCVSTNLCQLTFKFLTHLLNFFSFSCSYKNKNFVIFPHLHCFKYSPGGEVLTNISQNSLLMTPTWLTFNKRMSLPEYLDFSWIIECTRPIQCLNYHMIHFLWFSFSMNNIAAFLDIQVWNFRSTHYFLKKQNQKQNKSTTKTQKSKLKQNNK